MSGTSDRIFGDTIFGCEEAADKIDIGAWRGDNNAAQVKLTQHRMIGGNGANGCLIVKDC